MLNKAQIGEFIGIFDPTDHATKVLTHCAELR